ncbi:chemotaxis protein CheW [Pleurocapsales cyanobacterium LEGE 10410]|nr:chemotaxis protein CheW [Pleurocapsales cyanobacterium LEGE 10410]
MSISSPASRIQANLQELFKGNSVSGNPYIKFQLTSEITALLSMEQVQETLIVEAGQITPLPSMPESVIGMMNSRDRVFCVFDLAQLLTLPSQLTTPQQYQVIVLQTNPLTPIQVGLAVSSIQGIIRLPAEQIQSSTAASTSKIASYLSGVVQSETTMIPVLEFGRIWKSLVAV